MMPWQVSDFWGFEPLILAVVPATLPLIHAIKPKFLINSIIFYGIIICGMCNCARQNNTVTHPAWRGDTVETSRHTRHAEISAGGPGPGKWLIL